MLRRVIGAAVLLALAVPAAAWAGDPPTLGGVLGATRSEVIVESTATVPVLVTLTAPEGWQLAESSFVMEPGSRHVAEVLTAGDEGQIVAVMQATEESVGTDRSALVIALGTPKPPAPAMPPLWLLVIPLGAVAAAIAWRVRRHA